ncbi:hypothetical protein ACFLTA_08625 [Bacteroidota bacterium]
MSILIFSIGFLVRSSVPARASQNINQENIKRYEHIRLMPDVTTTSVVLLNTNTGELNGGYLIKGGRKGVFEVEELQVEKVQSNK